MLSISFLLAHVLFLALCLFPPQVIGGEKKPTGGGGIRSSVLAGTWYPETQDALAKRIQGLLSRAEPSCPEGELKGLVAPHAGYKYSGSVAAHGYRLLEERQFGQIIIIGPSHRMGFRGVSVNLQSGYETPLGVVPVNLKLAKKILNAGSHIRWIKEAHAREHSLEIQLPFLQTVLDDFQIVPILMGQQDFDTCLNLAHTLEQALGVTEDALVVASSDLSHYHTYSRAKALDLQFIRRVRAFDPQGLSKDLSSGKCEACGGGPVITTLLTTGKLGANRAVILRHANSGDVTGDHGRVVGYVSAALIRSSDTGPDQR